MQHMRARWWRAALAGGRRARVVGDDAPALRQLHVDVGGVDQRLARAVGQIHHHMFDHIVHGAAMRIHAHDLAGLDVQATAFEHAREHLADRLNAEHARAAALTDPNAEPILDFAAPYIVSYNKLRSGEVARRLTVPLLVLHGSQDGNVAAEPNFAAWKTVLAGKDATFHLYPEDNHFLLTKDDLSLDQHVDGRVIHDMVAWLQRWP